MDEDPRALLRVHAYYTKTHGLFVVDGRDYRTPDEVQAAFVDAFDAMQALRKSGFVLTRTNVPAPALPKWRDVCGLYGKTDHSSSGATNGQV